jgi:hypothetical protein
VIKADGKFDSPGANREQNSLFDLKYKDNFVVRKINFAMQLFISTSFFTRKTLHGREIVENISRFPTQKLTHNLENVNYSRLI